ALGYDTVALIHQILAYQAANNSVSQFLGFLAVILFAFLMARTLFNLFTKQFVRFVRRSGAEVNNIEDTWFSGLERPAIYLISLLGARVACNVLTQAPPGEVQELVFAIATRAVHVALTANLTWIAFILIDKAWEHFLLPIAIAAEAIDEQLVILVRKVAKIGVAVIGFVFMIKSFGQDPGTVLAGLGIGGLAVSFAAKDSLSPILSGVVIHLTKPFRINDFIMVGDADEGVVEEIDMRTTVLSQRDGSRLIVPNDKLTTSVLRNYTRDGLTTDKIHLSIDVGTPPDKRDAAIEMLKKTALEVDGVEEVELVFFEYQEDALEWNLLYRIKDPRQLNPIRTTIMLLIDARLRELGVEIDMPSMMHSFTSYLEEQPDMRKLLREALTGGK
ncbi:MAG: mechanosensitive ion channel family protein, partial [Verrucomicrobiota bacterium]